MPMTCTEFEKHKAVYSFNFSCDFRLQMNTIERKYLELLTCIGTHISTSKNISPLTRLLICQNKTSHGYVFQALMIIWSKILKNYAYTTRYYPTVIIIIFEWKLMPSMYKAFGKVAK